MEAAPATLPEPTKARSTPSWLWPLVATVLAMLPVANGFTDSRIFHYRDLGKWFWPYHEWIRHTVAGGHLPLWNPEMGGGYPAAADPASQIWFLPTLPIRLLLPEALAFNLSVALSLPTAALGAFLFFRRHCSEAAAALGAIVFAMSGYVVTSANMPNFSWSVAIAPWVLWRVDGVLDRRSARSLAALAAAFGLQALAGEPMTLLATAALAVAYAVACGPADAAGWRARGVAAALVVAGGLLGALLSAVEALPLVDLVVHSTRAAAGQSESWTLHPASLVELIVPSPFGSSLDPIGQKCSWYPAFNGGKQPLLAIYTGLPAIALAYFGVAAPARRRWSVFWVAVAAAGLACALGSYTPIYPLMKATLPLVGSFRYPIKLFVLVALAAAALAAAGWDALGNEASGRWVRPSLVAIGLVAAVAAATLVWVVASGPAAVAALTSKATSLGLRDPATEGERMADLLRAAAPRLLIMAALAGFFVWHLGSQRPRARPVRAALFAVIALDLLSASVAQNPTLDVALFERPAWAAEVSGRPEDRVFISAGSNLAYDPVPNVYTVEVPPSISTATLSTVYDAAFPSRPIAFGLGTPIDVGPTALRLEKYQRLVNRYDVATPEARLRFLERAGVRYYVVPESPAADAREVARIPDFDGTMALYERPVRSPRVEVVPGYRVVADEDDRIGELFSSRVDPSSTVLLAGEPPPAAGAAAEGRERAAEIVAETPNAVTVRADVPEGGGFLVLRDAYDPNWRAEVDGREVPVVRADVVFRAVRLEPGEHTVALRYAPRPMLVGAVISAAALAAILAMAAFGRRGQNVNRAAS